MARQYFDDGSWIEVVDGTSYAANTDGVVVSRVDASGAYYQSPSYWTDAREADKLNAFVAAPAGDTRPWYERVAEFGLTRAIDNHFGPAQQNKTAAPATFAGQNGQTYSQVGTPLAQGGGMGWLPLVAIGAAAFLLLRG